MCTATLGALYPAYFEQKDLIGEVDASAVIAMYGQAGGMAARTGQAVKLEAVYNGFIIILRNLIVIFDGNGYHSLACMLRLKHVDVRQQVAFLGHGLLSFFAAMVMITQKVPKRLICRRMRQNN